MLEKGLSKCFVTVFVIYLLVSSLRTTFVQGELCDGDNHGGHDSAPAYIIYSREFLLSLKDTAPSSPAPTIDIDIEQKTEPKKKQKKRGSRGGVRNRLRRRGRRLPLPTVTLTNACSIINKMDELSALVQFDGDYRRSNIICVTESWLSEEKSVEMDGYTTVRFDRDILKAEKECGGGLLMFVNKNWATNFTVRETVCTRDYEILTVSFRPHYLPREFGQVTVILVYVPGPNDTAAAERIAESYNSALARATDQPVLLLGDFNTCDVSKHLPHLHQYVTKPTRLKNILDKCYVNVPNAYVDRVCPPLGRSDHKVIHLLPTYKQLVKREEPKIHVFSQWNRETAETLRGCFELTDWDVFFENEQDHDALTDVITSYVGFCEDVVVPKKEVRVYSNNKPWVTKDLKKCLGEKKAAFARGDLLKVRELDREFKRKAKIAKRQYKKKVEERFTEGNARDAWRGLNVMMGRVEKKEKIKCDDPLSFANDLNTFYARFDDKDFSREVREVCRPLLSVSNNVTISQSCVKRVFSRLNPKKAIGPDGIGGRVLKECADHLSLVFSKLFQMLMESHFVPRVWRTSIIIPVPKKSSARLMNDFRPVALTSVLCKCMERIVCNQLTASVADRMDPLQFAYKAKRGVEDATLTLLDLAGRHLDSPNTFVRVLMMDFSSAFNTLQPHLLLQRLLALDVSPSLVLWIKAFLCDRPQKVNVNGTLSCELLLNTGAPQGCVLSPMLFSIYTNEMMCNNPVLTLIKFADDMALIARLRNEETLSQYYVFISTLISWFDLSFLKLNVQKTKELCIEGSRARDPSWLTPIVVKDETVEQVDTFKYLGTVFDNKLSFSNHVGCIVKKANQRLYLIRKLIYFDVDKHIVERVYRALVESILVFNLVTWYGNLNVKEKSRLNRITTNASKIIGSQQRSLSDLYREIVIKKSKKILLDKFHPLNASFKLLPSGRRFRVPAARRNLYKKSFIPSAVKIMNS